MDKRAAQIQALLFAEGGGLTYAALEKELGCAADEVRAALDDLATSVEGTGLALIRTDTEAMLAIAPAASDIVARRLAEEYSRDIGDAGLEVLAILLYEGPSTRAQIDYVRGVNSSSSLRNLLARGLIERSGNPADGREFIYSATAELLAHMGVGDRTHLPEYGTISSELSSFKEGHAAGAADTAGAA